MRLSLRTIARLSTLGTLGIIPELCRASTGAQALATFISVHIIDQALVAFWGIATLVIFYSAYKLIVESHKDEALTNINNTIIFALVGFGIIASSLVIAQGLTTTGLSTGPISGVRPLLITGAIDVIRQYIITLSYSIFVLIIVISAMRMMLARGEQSEFDKWRKVIVGACIGVVIMFVANAIVIGVGAPSSFAIVTELVGLARFMLTLAGFGCGLALIIAGIMLIVSVDESLQDRAKKTIIGTLIALAIVLSCYAIIATFVTDNTFA